MQIVEAAYICDPGDNPVVQLSDEHQAYRWITKEELTEIQPMTDKMRDLVDKGFQYVESTDNAEVSAMEWGQGRSNLIQ